ncbi:hypothetical protein HDV03_004150 [Kappamyces sp. JEL0829]|nr:hypothetical protein HDV03_004150 [Kappamyces sp. JEL0829]
MTPLLFLLGFAAAHYSLKSPLARGSDELNELTGPCAKYAVGTRTPIAVSGSSISIASGHNSASMDINLSLSPDPASQTDFVAVTTGIAITKVGSLSFAFDASKIAGAKVGSNVTIQTIYNGPDGALYQCADVVLTNATAPVSSSGLQLLQGWPWLGCAVGSLAVLVL